MTEIHIHNLSMYLFIYLYNFMKENFHLSWDWIYLSWLQSPNWFILTLANTDRFTLLRAVISASLALQKYPSEEFIWILFLVSPNYLWSMWLFPIASVPRLVLQVPLQGKSPELVILLYLAMFTLCHYLGCGWIVLKA